MRDRLRSQSGMTLIELVVAMLICAVGIMSTIAVLDGARRSGDRSEAREMLAHHAQLELERALALDWDVLGHPVTPSRSTTAGHPSAQVTTDIPARYRFDRTDSARSEVLKVIGGTVPGSVPANGTPWVDSSNATGNRLTGMVYRYVTRDASDETRRITVVATVNPPATNPPLLVSSLVTNPQ